LILKNSYHFLKQIEDSQTKTECLKMYFRLFSENGMINSIHNNAISYDDFK